MEDSHFAKICLFALHDHSKISKHSNDIDNSTNSNHTSSTKVLQDMEDSKDVASYAHRPRSERARPGRVNISYVSTE